MSSPSAAPDRTRKCGRRMTWCWRRIDEVILTHLDSRNEAPAFGVRWQRDERAANRPGDTAFVGGSDLRKWKSPSKAASTLRSAAALQRLAPPSNSHFNQKRPSRFRRRRIQQHDRAVGSTISWTGNKRGIL